MLTVLNIVLPVFAVVAVGYCAVRFARFPRTGIAGMISFVNNYAVPCLLFRALLKVDFAAVFDLRILGGYYTSSLSVFAIGILVAIFIFRRQAANAVVAGISASFANGVLLGVPIMQRAFGEGALPVVYSIIAFQAAIMLTVATITLELFRSEEASVWPTLKTAVMRVVTNPLIGGIALGALGNVSGITLPAVIDATTAMIAAAVLPVALFGLGGALNDYSISENWQQSVSTTALKLFLHPIIAWIVMVPVFGVPTEIARYGVLLAAMPTGINAYIFATRSDEGINVSANTILASTVLSIFSISLWLYLFSL